MTGQGLRSCWTTRAPDRPMASSASSALIPVGEGDHVLGAEEPELTLVEYGDFGCPFCFAASRPVMSLLERYDTLRLIWRHFPDPELHPGADLAAELSELAADSGAFWQAHSLLLAGHERFSLEDLLSVTRRLDLDQAEAESTLRERTYRDMFSRTSQAPRGPGFTLRPPSSSAASCWRATGASSPSSFPRLYRRSGKGAGPGERRQPKGRRDERPGRDHQPPRRCHAERVPDRHGAHGRGRVRVHSGAAHRPRPRAAPATAGSQLNNCSYCLNLHYEAARDAGIPRAKIDTLTAWWETDLHSEAEQAALRYTEALTRASDTDADRAFQRFHDGLAKHFDAEKILEIIGVVVNMNVWTRLKLAEGAKPRLG